jgi:hypothetical protein
MYQRTVKVWTQDGSESDVSRHPHRQFFGLDGHFGYALHVSRGWDRPVLAQLRENYAKYLSEWGPEITPEEISELSLGDDNFPYGQLPFKEFFACGDGEAAGRQHQPRNAVDVARVEAYLRAKRLPQELVLQITACTEYDRLRPRLPVPHDPLHRRNRRQLRQHLDTCWRILVRCNMLARELGTKIDWAVGVVEALDRMVSSPVGMKLYERGPHESGEFWQTTLRGGSGELPYSIPD